MPHLVAYHTHLRNSPQATKTPMITRIVLMVLLTVLGTTESYARTFRIAVGSDLSQQELALSVVAGLDQHYMRMSTGIDPVEALKGLNSRLYEAIIIPMDTYRTVPKGMIEIELHTESLVIAHLCENIFHPTLDLLSTIEIGASQAGYQTWLRIVDLDPLYVAHATMMDDYKGLLRDGTIEAYLYYTDHATQTGDICLTGFDDVYLPEGRPYSPVTIDVETPGGLAKIRTLKTPIVLLIRDNIGRELIAKLRTK